MDSRQLTVVELLQRCRLPSEDLTAAHMADFFVERDGEKVIACVGLEVFGESGLLRSLAVDERYRGRGFGRKLAHAIEQHAISRDVQQLYLLTDTAPNFFAKLGYEQIERDDVVGGVRESAEFRTLCPDSAICMTKWVA